VLIFVGLFIWGLTLPNQIEKEYELYKFSLDVPSEFQNIGGQTDINLLDSYILETSDDDFNPILQINVYSDIPEYVPDDIDEYKEMARNEFESYVATEERITYEDGGIFINKNNVKIYYDIVIISGEEEAKQKNITFYHNDRQITLYWTDDVGSYSKYIEKFDDIVQTIRFTD